MHLIPSEIDFTFRLNLKRLIKSESKHPLAQTRREIEQTQSSVESRVLRYYELLRQICPKISKVIDSQKSGPQEDVNLFFPSGFPAKNRNHFGMKELAHQERILRTAQLDDLILTVRSLATLLSAMRARKRKHFRGQKQNTSAMNAIFTQEDNLNLKIAEYTCSRKSLLLLGFGDDDNSFPPLSRKDCYKKPTELKRQVGDSRRPDGNVWGNLGTSFRSLDSFEFEREEEDEEGDDADLDEADGEEDPALVPQLAGIYC
jgi:hypothetical protein